MSGVLHRLAAQAMGSGGTVRSAARLPFLAAPGLVERHSPIDPLSEAPAVSPLPDEQSDFVRNAGPPAGFPTREANVSAGSIVRPEAGLGVKPPAETAITESRPAIRAEPKAVDPAPPVRMQKDIGMDRAPEDRKLTLSDASRERNASEAMPPPLPPGTRFPEPLLPLQNAPLSAAAPRTAATAEASMAGRSARKDEGGDVHVTIGLIELTAVHEAPRVKPAAPRQAPQLTLDDYLARRRGGRR